MSLEDFLESLTPEQLEHLAKVKREKEQKGPKKKRKQSRKKQQVEAVEAVEEFKSQPSRPTRRKGGRKQKLSTVDKMLKKKGSAARRLGPTELGERPNRFLDGDLRGYSQTSKEDIEIDKRLNKDRVPIRNTTPKRETEYFVARCSKCDDEFDNVLGNLCYKDGAEYIFVCEDCIKDFQ